MARIYILHNPSRRIEYSVKQCGIAVLKRGFMEKIIDSCERRPNIRGMFYLGGLDAGHHQRGLKSLSRNISNRYAEFASRKTKHVVKVSAHNFGWTVHYTTLDVV